MERFSDVRNLKFNKTSEVIKDEGTINEELIITLTFNEATDWKNTLSDTNLPSRIIKLGKIKGFGVEAIHSSGIKGNNQIVAIIDQPIDINHLEYSGKIISYKNFSSKQMSSMHGPAVTSLLVGNEIGVAPNSKVIYAGVPAWKNDALYEVKALEWILEENKKLPKEKKIKFVSVSSAPSCKSVREKNSELWMPMVEKASKEGIEVIDCTQEKYKIGAAYYTNIHDKNNWDNIEPGWPNNNKQYNINQKQILVPTSLRTVAEAYGDNNYGYTYIGEGGLSWGIPFMVGTLLLGSEFCPQLTAKELINYLYESCYVKNENKYINPVAFLTLIKTYNCKGDKHENIF